MPAVRTRQTVPALLLACAALLPARFAQSAPAWELKKAPLMTRWAAQVDPQKQSGPGGFGGEVPSSPRVGTPWTTSDIWLRRTFNPGSLTAEQISQLVFRDHHDEDVEIFINGMRAYNYEYRPLTPRARHALHPNAENTLAVHCRQTGGGQYIDVGIFQRIPAKK